MYSSPEQMSITDQTGPLGRHAFKYATCSDSLGQFRNNKEDYHDAKSLLLSEWSEIKQRPYASQLFSITDDDIKCADNNHAQCNTIRKRRTQ